MITVFRAAVATSLLWVSCAAAVAQTSAPAPGTPSPSTQVPSTTAPAAAPALPDAPSALEQLPPPAVPTGPTVLLDTSMGRITCQLFDKEAPATSANFVGLATGTKTWTDPVTHQPVTGKPFYNGTQFHRVIPGFMIQGGDPLANGSGDAGYYIPDEISPALRFDVPGRLAMANSGPNTSSSQFFITEKAYPTLNGGYTIFGQCDPASVAVVTAITHVPRDYNDKPFTPVLLNKVTVIPAGQPVPPAPAVPGSAPGAAPPGTAAPGTPARGPLPDSSAARPTVPQPPSIQ